MSMTRKQIRMLLGIILTTLIVVGVAVGVLSATDTAAGIILMVQENDGILMLKANNKQEYWMTPGGLIDVGETPQIAAVREFYEETGFHVPDSVTYFDEYVENTVFGRTTLYLLKYDADPKLLEQKFQQNAEVSEDCAASDYSCR